LSPHHLSEVLNQHAGKNFNHFINAYRVKEVCEKLNSSSSLKVLDIAIQSGFSSKSTFNTIFKKFMGVTPTQYREKIRQK
jgi:AraC-like DNA-binding protein